MNKLKKQNGITLIALVITIIVMLILVAVTITVAVNGGLFDYARKAGQETNKAIRDEQELASILSNLTTDELIGKYTGGWYPKGDGTFTNGKSTVALGDYINYKPYNAEYAAEHQNDLKYESKAENNGYTDEEKQTFTVTENSNDIKWRVLGVENGNLLIMMTTSQKPQETSEDGYYLKGAEGYNNGISELNTISKIYGHGEYAVDARSINVEDVNKITGYDPLKEGTGKPCGDGAIYEYKNGPITYTLTDTGVVAYESKNKSGTSTHKKLLDVGATNDSETLTIKESTYYYYYPDNEEDMATVMSTDGPGYKMLFGETGDDDYWLASSYVNTNEGTVDWGLRCVVDGGVDGYTVWHSYYGAYRDYYGMRAVVSLKSDITLTEGTVIEEGVGSWNLPVNE